MTNSKLRNNELIYISEEPLSVSDIESFLRQAEGGAVNLFVGTTRRVTGERVTTFLSYEAAEALAVSEITRIVDEARKEWPILRVAVVHRIGIVPVGEASVVIGVATAHRAESFDACRFLIDKLKQHVPIWKKENFSDGRSEWVQGNAPD